MLYFIFKYIYFFIFSFLLFLLVFKEYIVGDILNYILVTYVFVWIPIFDFLIDYFKKEVITEKNTLLFWKMKYFWFIFFQKIYYFLKKYKEFFHLGIIGAVVYLVLWGEIINFLFWLFFIFSIYLRLDSRYAFLFALLFLFFTSLFFLLGDQIKAELFSVYVYYLLIIWVILTILESYYLNIISFFWRIKKKLQENLWLFFSSYDNIVYDSFFLFFIAFLVSFYYISIYQILPSLLFFVMIVYILGKILWFSLEKQYKKVLFFNTGNYNYYILFFSINIIVFSQFLRRIDILNNMYYLIWITITLLVSFLLIATDIWECIRKIIFKNIYIFLSFLGIFFILIWFSSFYWFYNKLLTQNTVVENTTNIQKIKPIIEELPLETVDIITQENQNNLELPEIETKITTFDISQFSENLALGSEWENVKNLQLFLNEKWYYNFSIDGNYDINTQSAMRRFLNEKCWWKQDNQWILWPLARECIKKMLIE